MKNERLGELIANAVSHGIGAFLGVLALIILVLQANTTVERVGVIIFSVSMIILYMASTLYHAFPKSMSRVVSVFKRMDHIAIYFLIAGTYTPFILLLSPNTKGYILLGVLWGITFIGVIMKSIWIRRFHVMHVIMYLLMGWSVLTVWPEIRGVIEQPSLYLLFGGGIAYTLGVVFYASRFPYAHLVWHIFVMLGTMLHFFSIYYLL